MKKTNMIKSMLCVGIAFGMVLGSVLSGQAETEEQGKYILKSAGEEQGILTGKMYEESSFDLF